MDPRKLFSDERLRDLCAYCCGPPETRDHVPSRVLLDDPMPNDLPVVECCSRCNNGFSRDEEYVAAFIECVVCGSTDPADLSRTKISRALEHSPALVTLIADAETTDDAGQRLWKPDAQRVRNVLEKLARGHAAYELNVLPPDEPSVKSIPITFLDEDARATFLDHQETPFFSEVGSRAFVRACKNPESLMLDRWIVVQPGRYEYLVTQANGTIVRMLLSNYLACEVCWD